jgi:hypothetical protein
MSALPETRLSPAAEPEAAADQAIAACEGDARETVKALLAACDFLEAEVAIGPRSHLRCTGGTPVTEELSRTG